MGPVAEGASAGKKDVEIDFRQCLPVDSQAAEASVDENIRKYCSFSALNTGLGLP